MKLAVTFCVLFTLGLFSSAEASPAFVAGIFHNASVNERLEIQVSHHYINGKSSSYKTMLSEDKTYNLEVDMPESQLVTLVYRESRLQFYLEKGDTLFIEANAFDFPMNVKFSGKAATNNQILHKYYSTFPTNFNEFSKLRYKIGASWFTVDPTMDGTMQSLDKEGYMAYLSKWKTDRLNMLDQAFSAQGARPTKDFRDFITAEVLYENAYLGLLYGNVYKTMHKIEPAFFEYLYEVPFECTMIGSANYRQFLMALMAHRFQSTKMTSLPFVHQYLDAPDILSGKPLAFVRSELVFNALNGTSPTDILPYYTSFLQNNELDEYEDKVADVFEKVVKVSPGAHAPEFTATDYNGNQVSLVQYRDGKTVYLNFWASYCGACIRKMNEMKSHSTSLAQGQVEIINISIDQSREAWQNAIALHGVQGVNILANEHSFSEITKTYGVEAIPQYFIISKNGNFAEKPLTNKVEDIVFRLLEIAKK